MWCSVLTYDDLLECGIYIMHTRAAMTNILLTNMEYDKGCQPCFCTMLNERHHVSIHVSCWIALLVIGSNCSRDWYSLIALTDAATAAAAGTQAASPYAGTVANFCHFLFLAVSVHNARFKHALTRQERPENREDIHQNLPKFVLQQKRSP